jgi:tetratricopeptide (TPR) repeat protein
MLPYAEDITKFKEILDKDPGNAQIWCSWGIALIELKRFDDAVEKFKKAAELNPHLPSAWYGWGISLSALGKKEAAAEKIKKAMAIDPDSGNDPAEPAHG